MEVSKIGLDYSFYDQTSLIQSVFNTNVFEFIDTNYYSLIVCLGHKGIVIDFEVMTMLLTHIVIALQRMSSGEGIGGR